MEEMWKVSQVFLLISCSLTVILFPKLTRSQCSPIYTGWGSYELSEPPRDFEGMPTTGACTNLGKQCLGPAFPFNLGRLGDGYHGPQTLSVSAVQAWDRDVRITMRSFISPIVGINLYFYNIPSRRIGLPYDISVRDTFTSSDTQFVLEGNQDFRQHDNQLRHITLVPQSLNGAFIPEITFTFSERDHIDWLLLTEMEFCTNSRAVTLPNPPPPITFTEDTVSSVSPSAINSSITLTCSVTEGRFDWSWTGPPGISLPSPIVLNVGRTSVLELSQLSAGHSGTYRCMATHTYGREPRASASFDISTQLQGTLQVESSTIHITASDSTATLRCTLYGYLPSEQEPSIMWRLAGTILSNNSVYTITNEDGDMLIQNGGPQPIPSLTSTLTIDLILSPVTGSLSYICLSSQASDPGFQNITLMQGMNTPPPVDTATPSPAMPSPTMPSPTMSTFSSTTAPPTPSSDDNLGLILGVVISAIVLLVTIIIIVITLLCIVRRRSQKSMNYPNEYSEPHPPPLPAQLPSFSVSDIRPYASVDVTGARQIPNLSIELSRNAAYGLEPVRTGFIGERIRNGERQVHNSDIELSGNAAYGLEQARTGFIEERIKNGERQVRNSDIELSGNAAYRLKPDHTGERENAVRQVSTEIHLNGNAACESKPANFVGGMQSELHELQDTLKAARSEDLDPMIPQYQEHVFSGSNLERQGVESENTHAQFPYNIGMNENMAYRLSHMTNGTVDPDATVWDREEPDPVCDQSASAVNQLPQQQQPLKIATDYEVITFSHQQPTAQQQAATELPDHTLVP